MRKFQLSTMAVAVAASLALFSSACAADEPDPKGGFEFKAASGFEQKEGASYPFNGIGDLLGYVWFVGNGDGARAEDELNIIRNWKYETYRNYSNSLTLVLGDENGEKLFSDNVDHKLKLNFKVGARGELEGKLERNVPVFVFLKSPEGNDNEKLKSKNMILTGDYALAIPEKIDLMSYDKSKNGDKELWVYMPNNEVTLKSPDESISIMDVSIVTPSNINLTLESSKTEAEINTKAKINIDALRSNYFYESPPYKGEYFTDHGKPRNYYFIKPKNGFYKRVDNDYLLSTGFGKGVKGGTLELNIGVGNGDTLDNFIWDFYEVPEVDAAIMHSDNKGNTAKITVEQTLHIFRDDPEWPNKDKPGLLKVELGEQSNYTLKNSTLLFRSSPLTTKNLFDVKAHGGSSAELVFGSLIQQYTTNNIDFTTEGNKFSYLFNLEAGKEGTIHVNVKDRVDLYGPKILRLVADDESKVVVDLPMSGKAYVDFNKTVGRKGGRCFPGGGLLPFSARAWSRGTRIGGRLGQRHRQHQKHECHRRQPQES